MPGKNRIALNGFGRIGRQLLMQTTIPYLPGLERRAMQNMLKEASRIDTVTSEQELTGLDRDEQRLYVLTRHADNSYTFHLPETDMTDVRINGELPKGRYHDRTFPKDYAKKKKAKRRAEKQSRKKHKNH